jgi:ABC-type multidrug transport system fused ATPase/permease subunit
MAGGVLLAQGTCCFFLLLPLLLREFTKSVTDSMAIIANRLSISVQSITGILWLIVGLLDDRVNEASVNKRRKTFGLMVTGFFILFLSCFALMLSYFPLEADSRNVEVHDRSDIGDEGIEIADDDMEEPLLSLEERFLNESQHELDNSHPLVEVLQESSEGEPTSRICGTRRLLAMAKPQTLYLYIGCITLLVRLPFSLSIPHFVSSTLGALSQSQYDRAQREIFYLFILGTVDAFLDFWCIFWFGYANQRIVRGVRIDTFASILKQEIGFFDQTTSGELASRLNSDCGEMAGGTSDGDFGLV